MTAAPAETPEKIDGRRREKQEQENRRQLDTDEYLVDRDALAYAAHKQERQEQGDENGRQVNHAAIGRHRGPGGRQFHASRLQQADDISRPAARDSTRPHGILKYEVPADKPRKELADRRIGVGIGGARHRHHRSQLGIRHADETAGDAGDQEGQHECRSCIFGSRYTRQHENARADNDADAEQRDIERAHGPPQVRPRGILLVRSDALCTEDSQMKQLLTFIYRYTL